MRRKAIEVIVFDAMGVLYECGDDVGELLIPYLRGKGCTLSEGDIDDLYRAGSLGEMSSADFWAATGAADVSDGEYCGRHRLTEGIVSLLGDLSAYRIACLSNDVSEWSVLLRQRFDLAAYIGEWVISGDIGARKPDHDTFTELCRRLETAPDRILFVDDRPANVASARQFGLDAIEFRGATVLREHLDL